jgi:photosystem II stability/assembly factor-like uncharacterized protein
VRLWDVHFDDALHGVAGGERGVVFSTSDGGATWINRRSGSSTFTYGMSALDLDHAWSANSFGEVLYTTDGGARWNVVQAYGQYSHMHAIDFADAQTGWVVGDAEQSRNYGVILRSSDGGANWSPQWFGSGLDILYGVAALDAQTAVAVGVYRILRTRRRHLG